MVRVHTVESNEPFFGLSKHNEVINYMKKNTENLLFKLILH